MNAKARTAAQDFGERLRAQRTRLGLSIAEAARRARNMPLGSYRKYDEGHQVPGGEALAALADAGFDLVELVTGRAPGAGNGVAPASRDRVEEPRASYVYLPLYEEMVGAAGAGIPAPSDERVERELAFQEDFIRHSLGARPGDLILARVRGDSGEPVLRDGDIALINRAERDARSDAIYFIRMGDALLYKQLQRLPGGRMKVSSRNMAYEPFTVDLEKLGSPDAFDIIGRVVWACRRL